MANKKINELSTRTPSLSDLMLVGDPSSGYSYKCTITSLATIIETDIADGYVTLGTTQTITGAKTFSNNLTLTSVSNAGVDTDKFLVLNGSNIVNFRTGSEVLSDIGGQGALTLTTTGTSGAATLVGNTLNIPNYAPDLSGYVPTSRTITINGTTQDLTANRTYNVGTVTSVAASAGTGISISGSPITTSGTITITNTAPDQIVALTAGTGISVSGTYPNFTITNSSPSSGGTVTSVALSAPTGFAVTGSPITSSGTLALAFSSGYSLPTTASQSNWNSAYDNMIVSAAVTGTTTKTLTLTQQDAGTITASWSDLNTDAVTSVFGRTGAVVAANGDYTTAQVTESGNLYYTDARARASLSAGTGISYSSTTGVISSTITQYTDALARAAISLTTTGSSGAATYSSSTGVLNIPTYTLAGLGGISLTSLSALAPLSYNNTTGAFSIALATASTDGYLRFQDWNFFADKIGGSGTTNYIPKFTSSSAIGNSAITDDGTNVSTTSSISLNNSQLYVYNPSVSLYGRFGWEASYGTTGAEILSFGSSVYQPLKFRASQFDFYPNGTTSALTLNASGNLGLGVTPSAWRSTNPAFQLGQSSSLYSYSASNITGLGSNVYINSSGNEIYIANGTATTYTQNINGEHRWNIASSGTAGNAISFTQAMTLNASGRLLVGTTTDNTYSRLQVSGSAWIGTTKGTYFTDGATYSSIVGLNQAVTAYNGLELRASGTDGQLFLATSGNVGIGTTSPSAPLNIVGSNGGSDPYSHIRIDATGAYPNNIAGLAFNNSGIQQHIRFLKNGTEKFQIRYNEGNTETNKLNFYSFITSTDIVTFDANTGNVGIGTTSPDWKLTVQGTTGTSIQEGLLALRVTSATNTNGILFVNSGNTSSYNDLGGIYAKIESGNAKGYLGFYTRNSDGNNTDVAERMRITSGGNVGINTTTPNSILDVAGSVAAAYASKTATYTLTGSDYTVRFDAVTAGANLTANLPDATTCKGRIYVIMAKLSSTRNVTLDGNGAQTIGGSATWGLWDGCNTDATIVIQSDGSNWNIISYFGYNGTC